MSHRRASAPVLHATRRRPQAQRAHNVVAAQVLPYRGVRDAVGPGYSVGASTERVLRIGAHRN